MKLLLQLLFLVTCFTSSALPIDIGTAPNIVVPTNTSPFQQYEQVSHSEKAKIGVQQNARSLLEGQQAQTTTFLGFTHLTATDFSKLKTVNTLTEAQTASLYTKMSTALNYEDEVVRVCKAIEQRNSYTAVEKQYLNSLLDKEKKLANARTKNLLVKVIDDALDHVSGAGKFTLQQIEDYVALATKQGNQSKVMLGKTDAGGVTGYVSRAGNDHAYFKMADFEWDEALTSVGNDLDEMWKVNKKFIDNRKALGNEFYLSLNPATADGFYLREINYLTKSIGEGGLGGSVVDLGNNLWKIVW